MTITVVVAEDEPLVRSGILAVLAAAPDIRVVGQAGDGRAVAEHVRALAPHVVLTDLRMPEVDGIELTRLLQGDADPPPVLVLTGFADDPQVHAALRAGAAGYLLKQDAPRFLAEAIRSVAAGRGWIDPAVVPGLLATVRRVPEPTGAAPERLAGLTGREREVLVLLSQGLDNAEIAARLWLGHGTVKTHVSRILHKTACRDRAQVVALAYACGMVAGG